MKVIIDIPEDRYKEIMTYKEGCVKLGYFETIIANGTPIPDNATNGDVISSIFNIDIKDKLVHDDINAYEITVDLGTNWTTLRIKRIGGTHHIRKAVRNDLDIL